MTPFEQLRKAIDYNSSNFGVLGIFIKTEYAQNQIDDFEKRVKEAIDKCRKYVIDGYKLEYGDSEAPEFDRLEEELGLK